MDHVTIFSLIHILCNIEDGALCDKKDNSWELLLNVSTESFFLNVTGLVDLTLKHIDELRLYVQSQQKLLEQP